MSEQNISCEEVLEHICDNLDEELNSPKCETIRLHINDCPDCFAYLKSLKTTINLYKEYPSPCPSESAKRSIEETILKKVDSLRHK